MRIARRLMAFAGWYYLAVAVCFCLYLTTPSASAARSSDSPRSSEAKLVSQWAETIGNELWRLANAVVQPTDLLQRYKKMGVKVEPKSGENIIRSISENVGRMLHRKMDAVKCLYKQAENLSEIWRESFDYNYTYYSAKYSNITIEHDEKKKDKEFLESNVPSNMYHLNWTYVPMELEPDTHFNNISVNVTFSSVHVPTNVWDRLYLVSETVRWSKHLDRVFRHNYRADPALMWQYFCSTTGVLRQYPAMHWPMGLKADGKEITDTYDCRIRSWFIEAATCSKDVVILMDNSGSMTGMSNTIAKATVATILSTLSNNDYVAVFNFSDTTDQVVGCFKDRLIQAIPQNLRKFNDEINEMKPEGVANITEAFLAAFDILDYYRNESRCGSDRKGCNQMIMLVTDGIASNITEVFEKYNWPENETMPVRVFTYLLGNEVTKVREIQWMACLNRGYYAHIHTQAEVQEQVLKYIPVVARPLALHGKVHPVVWTHAYVDISREPNTQTISKNPTFIDDGTDITEEEEEDKITSENGTTKKPEISWKDRLLTSVSIPVFNRTQNRDPRKPNGNILGVVGTDVPLKDIRKLTLPYKLGVNGYAFIVSNNGYVVLHPALKPDHNGELKLNYNSIDLTEVEILDDGKGAREIGEEIKEIRRALVNHECGSQKNVKVKLHYDDYRRVNLESRDYFYAPLPFTPFGIAVVLPQYGRFYIKATREIERYSRYRGGKSILDYFVGENWGIHPHWVYCRYHYPEDHEFDTPEAELLEFLKIVGNLSLTESQRFPEQYKRSGETTQAEEEEEEEEAKDSSSHCHHFSKVVEHEPDCDVEDDDEDYDKHLNDHYCNKELMELLIMDAVATNESFSGEFRANYEMDRRLIDTYKVYLRFMSTQSGLTRWQRIQDAKLSDREDRIRKFAKHKRALDEPWYKGAIFQNVVDPDSVSVTVPPIKELESGMNATVTISLGIYPHDNNRSAAAGVAGLQMPMVALHDRIMDILTDRLSIPSMNCSSIIVDCYLIDQNGYIVISEAHGHDTGKFFGVLDQSAPIMESLVKQGLFSAVSIYDYLAYCEVTTLENAASMLKTPFVYAWNFLTWLFARSVMLASQVYDLPTILAQEDLEEEVDFSKPGKLRKIRKYYPCDTERTLYILNKTNSERSYTNEPNSQALPFYAQRIPHTNLLLVIVKTDQSSNYAKMSVEPEEIFPYEIDGNITVPPCHKLPLNDLFRRRLEHCYTYHEDEDKIDACGGTGCLKVSSVLLFFTVTLKSFLKFI